jgi:simple sugar transport system ATP-binding protein
MPEVLLEMSGISKAFGDKAALSDASFELTPGEVHALLGENGAGKSTLMMVACGIYRADAGIQKVDGRIVDFGGPRDAIRAGIGMVHQHFRLVEVFTVLENVMLTVAGITAARIRELGAQAGLQIDPDRRVSELSVAEQQRVEILKVLAGGARILLLDEPTAVLTDEEARSLLLMLRELAKRGLGVVLITHKLHQVAAFADRVTVMRGGRTVARNVEARGLDREAITRLVIGEVFAEPKPAETPSLDWVRLKVQALSGPKFGPLDFDVRAREVVGIAGIGGGGQSELVDVLAGILAASAGSVEIDGHVMTKATPARRRDAGLRMLPADRYSRALAADLDIASNMALTTISGGRFGSWRRADRKAMRRVATQAIAAFDVKGGSPSTKVRLLSGGNAQKLLIAREFGGEPSVIVCHSPTRGLDVQACRAVDRAIREAREAKGAILLISEDLDEVLALSDIVLVLADGRFAGHFKRTATGFDRAAIGAAMVCHV